MKKSLFCFLAWLLLSLPALGMRGRVTDEAGQPIIDARVTILGYSGSVRTGRLGTFFWTPDPEPPFEILVVLANGQYMKPILVQDIPVEEVLEVVVSPITSDQITVTAGVTPNIEATAASARTVVGRQEIETLQPTRLVDSVGVIPGVDHVSEGIVAVPSIRGMARGRTLILLDGGRVTTERRTGPSATFLDPFFLEGIEVARGPAVVAYGSNAFGGVIHARTRRPTFDTPLGVRFSGNLGAGVPELSAGLQVYQGWKRFGYLMQGSFRQLGDYESPRGEVGNSAASFDSFQGKSAMELGPGLMTFGWQYDRGQDIGRPRNNSDRVRFFYPEEESSRFNVSYEMDPWAGFSVLNFDFFLGDSGLITREETLPRGLVSREITESDVRAKDYGFRALMVRPLEGARWEAGIDLNGRFNLGAVEKNFRFDRDDQLEETFEQINIDDADGFENSGYTSIEVLIARHVTGAGGVRFTAYSAGNTGGYFGDISTSDFAWAGFGSLSYRPWTGLDLTGQVSRGYRQPSLSDRYYRGITARGSVTGNPDLEPESSLQLDLGARLSLGRTRWGFYAYRYRIQDLIERYELEEDHFYFRNRGEAVLRGVELEFAWPLREGLELQAGAQAASGEASDNGSALDDVPAESVTLGLRKDLLGRGHVGILASAFARDTDPGPTEVEYPGYAVLDVVGGWSFGKDVSLGIQLRNLLDKDYPTSVDRRAVAAPGFHALVTLTVAF